jgi:hypothetical protein
MRSSVCGLAIGFGLALALSLTLSASIPGATDPPEAGTGAVPALPRIVLVGDSIRLGYAPIVAKRLEGKAVVISPRANGGDSANVLRQLDEWVIREQPAIVHFNCGIHDTKKSKTSGRFQVPPEAYAANLRAIVERIRAGTKAKVVFATTTPVLNETRYDLVVVERTICIACASKKRQGTMEGKSTQRQAVDACRPAPGTILAEGIQGGSAAEEV